MTRAYSIGIDQSANHSGVCVLDQDGGLVYAGLIEPKVVGVARLAYIRDALRDLLQAHPGAEVGVWESYAMKSQHRAFLLGEVGGVVQLVLHDAGVRQEMCAPTALKKFISSNHLAKKSEIMQRIRERDGLDFENDNAADAYALAKLGMHLLVPSLTTIRKEREVVHNILKPKAKRKSPFRINKGML